MYNWSDYYREMVSRNIGIITEEQQEKLRNSCVAIAGCGAEGGSAAIALSRMGIGNLKIAEPDRFEISNINRQFSARKDSLGLNKAIVVREDIKLINPECKVVVYPEGINENNIEEFLFGANIAIDAIDYRNPIGSVLLYRKAREMNICVIAALSIGWGSFLFFFEPDSLPFEEYIGANPQVPLEDFEKYSYPLSAFCPEPPLYVGVKLIQDVVQEKIEIPVVIPAVHLTAAMISSFVHFYINGVKKIKPAPYYYSIGDLFKTKPKKIPWWKKIIFNLIAKANS